VLMQKALLAASRRPGLRRAVTGNPATRKVVNRFVAGETLDDALAAVSTLGTAGIQVTLDFLGEDITSRAEATRTRDAYLALLERLAPLGLGPAADVYDIAAILNPDTGLANVLASFSDPKSEGTETINGVETVKVTGQVSADAVNKIAPPIAATGPVPGTAWIEKDGDHKLVQAKLEPSSGNSVQMTLSDWDKPVTVTKPAV